MKAIAQFERTLLSYGSKYDRVYCDQEFFEDDAVVRGFEVFSTEEGDCFHCHSGIHFTDHSKRNNGLDSFFSDLGLAEVTGNAADEGMFKTPTLRILVFTAPYMHDGRFQTIDEVIDFYSDGMHNSPTLDPLLRDKHISNGGVQMTAQQKSDLKAFLLSLTDSAFVNNPAFYSPF